jgi:hypothetical protein
MAACRLRLAVTLAVAAAVVPAAASAVVRPQEKAVPGAAGPAGTVVADRTVNVLPSATKIRPTDTPAGGSAASLTAARNESASFQVAVRADRPLANLSLALHAPLASHSARIPSSAVVVYREAYYTATQASDGEGATGRWPDALIPAVDPYFGERRNAFPVDVPSGENRVAWIDILVPRTTPAGIYRGALDVTANGVTTSVPVSLRVLAWTMPATSSLKTAYRMTYANVCQATYGDDCYSHYADGWALKALYARAALDNRITIENPYYQPYNGNARDAASFDRFMLPLLDGTAGTRLAGARLTTLEVTAPFTSSRYGGGSWRAEAEAHGFASRAFNYACDEPGTSATAWASCRRSMHGARSEWPALANLVTASIGDVPDAATASLVDWLSPSIPELEWNGHAFQNLRPAYDSWLARTAPATPRQIFSYTACESFGCDGAGETASYLVGKAGYAIDAPASEATAMGWLAFEHNLQGDLYWRVDAHIQTGWKANGLWESGGNGDGTLFYAGTPATVGGRHPIPIESMRMKLIRNGYQAYEYLELLARNGRGEEARSIAAGVFPASYETRRTGEQVAAAYSRLQSAVAAITG